MIGNNFRNINSVNDIIIFCQKYSLKEIHNFLKSECGSCLGEKLHGSYSQKTFGTISDIRRVYGAGLGIMSGTYSNLSYETSYCCELVFNSIKKNGFKFYTKNDGIKAYVCLHTISKKAA